MKTGRHKYRRPAIFRFITSLVAVLLWLLGRFLLNLRKERIWLIGCGGERWGDNAAALWRYLNRYHPEIRAVAVLKAEQDLAEKTKGPRLRRGSLKNILYMLKAEALITTHALTEVGPQSISRLLRAARVRIEHGVIGIKKMPVNERGFKDFNLICASSEREKKIMTGSMKLDADKIKITGLARHDYLKQAKEKTPGHGLLYLPTIRDWLTEKEWPFYRKMLFSWLENYATGGEKAPARLWLHPNWSKKGLGIDLAALENQQVEMLGLKEDPQQAMLASKILITDYSSMAFDAALAGLPVVFFQPDRALFIEKRGLYSDFKTEQDLLIIEDENKLLSSIERLLTDGDYRQQRISRDLKWALSYVETFDGRCCERIYFEIAALVQDRRKEGWQ